MHHFRVYAATRYSDRALALLVLNLDRQDASFFDTMHDAVTGTYTKGEVDEVAGVVAMMVGSQDPVWEGEAGTKDDALRMAMAKAEIMIERL